MAAKVRSFISHRIALIIIFVVLLDSVMPTQAATAYALDTSPGSLDPTFDGDGEYDGSYLTALARYFGKEMSPVDSSFQSIPLSLPDGWEEGYVWDVWGSNTSDVYAVGEGYNADHFGMPLLYHYDGTGWNEDSPGLPDGWHESYLLDIWGFSANDVYAVGSGINPGLALFLLSITITALIGLQPVPLLLMDGIIAL